jgi:hypothetical protein
VSHSQSRLPHRPRRGSVSDHHGCTVERLLNAPDLATKDDVIALERRFSALPTR